MKTKLLFFVLLTPLFIFSQSQIGVDIDGEASVDYSGISVSISSDGGIVAIGAPYNDGNGNASGHVRVYENLSGIWTQIGADIDSEEGSDNTGTSVSLSSDGSVVALGSPYTNGTGNRLGQVRMYQNLSGVWTQIGAGIDGEVDEDYSGASVSLSSDGNIVAIGAYYNNGNGIESGHVRVFENLSGVWTQVGGDIDGEAANDWSGYSVSLSSDGNIVAIGARNNSGAGYHYGHVRVYENLSGVWTQIGTDIDGEGYEDYSGESVSLSSDGSIVAIGAPFCSEIEHFRGCVRIYKNESGVWTKIGDDIDGEGYDDHFGKSVSLSLDGNIVAVGAHYNDGNGNKSGSVRIYQNFSGTWTQIGTDIDGEASGDESGVSVSLSSNGGTVAIGANLNDGNGDRAGHVRVYDLTALLSLEDNAIANSFNIYPNPAAELLQLTLNSDLELQVVKIYNTLGQQILKSEEKSLDISNLSTGLYYVEITTTKGKGVKKLMVK